MDILTALVIIIPTTLATIIIGYLGSKWLRIRTESPATEDLQEIVANYDADVKTLKSEISHWRGKFNSTVHKVKVDGDYDVDNDQSLVSLAKSVLPAISQMLPENIRPKVESFLNKPEIIDILAEIHKKFPSETKQILGGFIKNGAKPNQNDDSNKKLEEEMLQRDGA